jgi:phage shock protein A
MLLQEKLAERTKLLSQLEQAKMQEQVSASLNQMSELAAPRNTPSLEEVRDKIEKRYTNALGQAELASNSVQGRMLEVKKATTNMAAQSRLEEIRASMAGGSGAAPTSAIGTNQQPAISDAQSAQSVPADQPATQNAEPQN